MPSYKKARMDELDREIKELTGAEAQGGSPEPTQSMEEAIEGSPDKATEVTAGQEARSTETKAEEGTLDYWKERALKSENRYNVSKPKYDSNIYQLKQENITLQKSRVALQKTINELRQSSAVKGDNPLDKIFDQQTVDVLGQKTVDAIKGSIQATNVRVDKQEADAAAKRIEADEKKIRDQVTNDYDTFITELTRMVPDQAALNTDSGFLGYLAGVDELSGKIRFDLLRKGQAANEPGWVAQIFLDYKKTLGPAASKVKPVDSVNKRIAPSLEGATSATDIAGSGKISIEFVEQFNHEVTKGLYKGRLKEKHKIDALLDNAFMTGNLI